MNKIAIALLVFLSIGPALAAEMHMHHGGGMSDERISLGLPPPMKQHQLANMRSHLEAVRSIISLVAMNDFEKASGIAHTQLGLTEEMRKMCEMFDNKKFQELGLAFHKSGDELGDVLLKKNAAKSLEALSRTMGYCIECHGMFRQ